MVSELYNVIRSIRSVRRERTYNAYFTYITYKEGFLRSTVVYLKDYSLYLDSSFLVVILRIQLELIY